MFFFFLSLYFSLFIYLFLFTFSLFPFFPVVVVVVVFSDKLFAFLLDKSVRTCSAFFTYVSLDADGQVKDIPPLELHTDEERKRFEAGKKRYLHRVESRTSCR